MGESDTGESSNQGGGGSLTSDCVVVEQHLYYAKLGGTRVKLVLVGCRSFSQHPGLFMDLPPLAARCQRCLFVCLFVCW